MSGAGRVSRQKHIPSSQMLLQAGVLLSYSAVPCRDTHCEMLHEVSDDFSVK